MSEDVVVVRLSRNQAAFLQANLSLLATTTRQAMAQPGLKPERHMALGSRAIVLESTEDAVRSAMLEVPNGTRKNPRGIEVVAHAQTPRQKQGFGRQRAGITVHPAVRSLRAV